MPQTRAANENMSKWIGRFEERIDNLVEVVTKSNSETAEHRRDLRDILQAQSLSMQALTKEVSEMKPLVSDYRERRDQAIGAAKLANLLKGAALAGAGALGAGVVEAIRYFRS